MIDMITIPPGQKAFAGMGVICLDGVNERRSNTARELRSIDPIHHRFNQSTMTSRGRGRRSCSPQSSPTSKQLLVLLCHEKFLRP